MLPLKPLFNPNKLYILLGGFCGIDSLIAIYIFANGARKVILIRRRSKMDSSDIRSLRALQEVAYYPGVDFRILASEALQTADYSAWLMWQRAWRHRAART